MNLNRDTAYPYYEKMSFTDYTKYIEEEKLGYIKINQHPENENIIILNYTEKVTFEKRWNEQTMKARGLILDVTNATLNGEIYILAKPFEKFPNFGSNEIEGYEDDIDWNEVDTVMEKMDGSLGISYLFNGEIRFATRGSFTSEQALRATKIWRENHKYSDRTYHKVFGYDYRPTMLVEIIYPENRIVVDYDKREELVLIGAVDKNGDLPYNELVYFAHYLNMGIAGKYELTLEEMLEKKKTLSANEEGYIVRFKNGKRLKIKGDEYLQVHRIKHGMSTKAKYKAWSEGRLTEYIMMLPEEFREELETFEKQLNSIKGEQVHHLMKMYQHFNEMNLDRREFAISVKANVEPTYHKYLFRAYINGKIPEQMVMDDIYKNYEYYEGVINTWNKQDL